MPTEELEIDTSQVTLVFEETIQGDRRVVPQATDRIMETIRQMPCARKNLHAVRLALQEALANAIIHGNKEEPGKTVRLLGACEGSQKLLLVITDEGEGFDPAALPDPTHAENIYAEHGRGVYMINQLMCEAEYRLGGRQVVLRKKLAD